jgi:A/G-specific adenine glycosylase
VERHSGRFPDTFDEIAALPGIGSYTAGAIASIAFGERVPAIDGNATRVLARVFLVSGDVRVGRGKRRIHDLGQAAVPADRPGDHNQALMELGSLICLPKEPRCGECCLADICEAERQGKQGNMPATRPRPRTRVVRTVAGIVRRGGRLLIAQRPPEGVWGGLWEFPNVELKRGESPRQVVLDLLRDAFGLQVEVGEVVARIRHGIMNQRIELTAYACAVRRGRTKATRHVTAKWIRPDELGEYALPAPHGKIAQEVTGPDRAERGSRCRPRPEGGGQA